MTVYSLLGFVRGLIICIFGPMASGKSSMLLNKLRIYTIAHKKCILLKPLIDNRYANDRVVTHAKESMDAISIALLAEFHAKVSEYDIVGIDEGHMFPDLVKFCELWANMNKIVIVSGLDTNFKREPFYPMATLICIADKKEHLTAVCTCCQAVAPFTRRISVNKEEIVVGGLDEYQPVCRFCHIVPEESAIVGEVLD